MRLPPNTRTAADVPELHRPWSAAIATGLLRTSDGTVTSGHAPDGWPPGDAALLDAWFAGLRAGCRALADPRQEDGFTGMLVFALALLTVLEDEEVPTGKQLWKAVLEESDDLCDTYDLDLLPAAAMRRVGLAGPSRLGGMVALLAGFGAVTGDADRPVITPLGRWAVHQLEDAIPGAADPEMTAAELIAEVAEYDGAAQRLEAASEWLERHHPREILEAAESMSPLLRSVAADLVGMLDEYTIPAWREFTAAPHVGPHARYAVYAWDQGPEPGKRDVQWLATESAAVALDAKGPDEALCFVWESVRAEDLAGRLAVVRATGHPAAGKLARARCWPVHGLICRARRGGGWVRGARETVGPGILGLWTRRWRRCAT